MPAGAAADFGAIVPERLLPKLSARGISVDALAATVIAENFAPRELFALETETQEIRVWLE